MVAVISVALATITLVAATPPMVAVAPDANPEPVITTGVPPFTEPEFGLILVIVGAAADPGGWLDVSRK